MTCEAVRDLLSAQLDGELDEAERRVVEGHLAACASCAAEREALRRTVGLVKGLPRVAAPAALAGLVRAALPSAGASPVADRTVLPSIPRVAAQEAPRRKFLSFPRVAAALAAGLLVGVALQVAWHGAGLQAPPAAQDDQAIATAPPGKPVSRSGAKEGEERKPAARLNEMTADPAPSLKPGSDAADAMLAQQGARAMEKEMASKGRSAPGALPVPSDAPSATAAPAPPPSAPDRPAVPSAPPAPAKTAPASIAKLADAGPVPSGRPAAPTMAPSAPVAPAEPPRPAAPRIVAAAEPVPLGAAAGGGTASASGPALVVSLGAGDLQKQVALLDQLAYGGDARRELDRKALNAALENKNEDLKSQAADPAGGAGSLAETRRRAVQQATDRKEPVTLVYDLEPAEAARFMTNLAERKDIQVANVQADPGFFDIYANAAKPSNGVSGAYRKLLDRSRDAEGGMELAMLDKAKADADSVRKVSEMESREKSKKAADGREADGAFTGLARKDEAGAAKAAAEAAEPPALAAAAKSSAKTPGSALPAAPPAAAAPAPVVAGGAPAAPRRVRIVIRLATE